MRSRNWSGTLAELSGGNGKVLAFMACYDCCFTANTPFKAVGALRPTAMFDVTEQCSRYKTKVGHKLSPMEIDYGN